MEKVTIFKKFEVMGTTKDEAMANSGLNLRVDATQAYKKWASTNVVTEESQKEFFVNYLNKKKFNLPNDGAYVVLQSAIVDTRERPYEVKKIEYDVRTHTPMRVYAGRAQDTNEVLFEEKTSKAALQSAKEWIIENHVGVNIFRETRMKEKNSLYATVDYKASKHSRPCKLLVFGYKTID